MSKLLIFHGSDHIISKPVFGKGKTYNDYGLGFYCTESIELAKEWACSEVGKDGYANAYSIDTTGLKILNLSNDNYTILHWITLLINNRKFSTTTPIAKASKEYLLQNFLIDISNYDIIIGYRADDSYFSFAKDFINNVISVKQLATAMELGKLGEQIVIKSKRAFDSLNYIKDKSEFADSSIYFPKRETRNKKAQDQYLNTERNNYDIDGLFVRDIIRGKITNETFRL